MPHSSFIVHRSALAALCLAALAAAPAAAQSYPAKPIRFIVPWSAGSGTDLMARAFAQELSKAIGQSVVVDNRGGAGATIGTEAAAKSPPDGYTIYVGGSVSMVISPVLYPRVGYDPLRDFVPVSLVSRFYNVATVHPSVPVKSVKELIALARSRPGEVLMGSAGSGSTSHLAGELFKSLTATRMLHVPYKSGGQLVTAVLSGEAHLSFSPVSTMIGHAKNGKVRLLGVSSPKRLAALPELPAIAETVPGYEFGGWQGILVPAGTSPELVRQLHAAIQKAIHTQEFRDYLEREGSVLVGSSPEEFAKFMRAEVEKLTPIIRASGAKAE
ncbi:MAG TPA: tripartite tricarboxylate transporter substrate binding protein [Burkholderiales bacterium]|nr:tripartite tricarboxylate transporter substrate binding protein [Burkholderiales bacterium]